MRIDRASIKLSIALSLWGAGAGAGTDCAPEIADLRVGETQLRFRVEVVDDDAERAQGLMFRESLPRFGGMLFVYDRAEPVAFWMKNTLIPLDMLFFDEAGRLISVHENAVPGDLTSIPSNGPARFVLEINGGAARELGVEPGAELRHPAVDPEAAAWRCE
ncbi:MAG: DUF192 domain-containing protein [Rhodobacteraceae bacterium]|nr:DUF192 domain-containing protein [Paracoccaceae bacterium]